MRKKSISEKIEVQLQKVGSLRRNSTVGGYEQVRENPLWKQSYSEPNEKSLDVETCLPSDLDRPLDNEHPRTVPFSLLDACNDLETSPTSGGGNFRWKLFAAILALAVLGLSVAVVVLVAGKGSGTPSDSPPPPEGSAAYPSPPLPPPSLSAELVPTSVSTAITFSSMALSSLDDAPYEASFRAAFKRDLAAFAKVSPSAVMIGGIVSGSVVVESTVIFEDETPADTFASALSAVDVTQLFVSSETAEHAAGATVGNIQRSVPVAPVNAFFGFHLNVDKSDFSVAKFDSLSTVLAAAWHWLRGASAKL
eukprot:gene17203-20465_t